MARIHCELCIKTFRSDSGFAWHRRHIHDQETAPDEIRDLLEAEGVDRSTLDDITDAELIDLVNETLISI